jgi:hypothetical protein
MTKGSSRPTLQDQAATRVQQTSDLFLRLLERRKGKKKKAEDRENAAGYYERLASELKPLFKKRTRFSHVFDRWLEFEAVWDHGDGSWTDSLKAMRKLNEALRDL